MFLGVRMNRKIVAILFIIVSLPLLPNCCEYAHAAVLEEQVKFDVPERSIFEDIKSLPAILSYKLKIKGEYVYDDYYYDTPDLAIFKRGYSYRFRVRNKGDGKIEYGIQFKREYDVNDSQNFQRMEIDDVVSGDIGKRIVSGEWSEAVSDTHDITTVKRFLDFLNENKINSKNLVPIIFAKQIRNRYKLKEDGTLYFEISMDECAFSLMNATKDERYHFFQFEFENKYKNGTMSTNHHRIMELTDFFVLNYRLKVVRDSKYGKAIDYLMPAKDMGKLKK
jgi:hypothetical protein